MRGENSFKKNENMEIKFASAETILKFHVTKQNYLYFLWWRIRSYKNVAETRNSLIGPGTEESMCYQRPENNS